MLRAQRGALSTSGPDTAATAAPAPSPMLPSVRAGFPAFTSKFEGRVPFMYLDIKGFVTCAVGNLIDPMALALPLPWLLPDDTAASQDQIAAEWERVKAMPAGLVASRYSSPSGLHLDDAGIDALVFAHLDADAQVLARTFPDFPTFPAAAQQAILSMSWAMGSGFPARWPLFSASVRAQDWRACAENCSISAVGNPGVVPRNDANKALFLQAAGDADSGAGGDVPPANPNADAESIDLGGAPASPAAGDAARAPATTPGAFADNLLADEPSGDADAPSADTYEPAAAGAGGAVAAALLLAVAIGWLWRRDLVEVLQRIAEPRAFRFRAAAPGAP